MAKSQTTTCYRTPIHNELKGWKPYNPSKFEILPVADFLHRIDNIENRGLVLHRGHFTSFYETVNVYARLGISLASGLGMSEPYAWRMAKPSQRVLDIYRHLTALEECCNASLDERPLRFDDEQMRLRCNSLFAAKLASEIHTWAMQELGAVPAAKPEAVDK